MCTQIDPELENENEEPISGEEPSNENETPSGPRDINILLALDTYQGMTDEEIDLVLEYKIERALDSEIITNTNTELSARSAQIIADNRAAAQRALDMLEYTIGRETNVPSAEIQSFVPRSIEV